MLRFKILNLFITSLPLATFTKAVCLTIRNAVKLSISDTAGYNSGGRS